MRPSTTTTTASASASTTLNPSTDTSQPPQPPIAASTTLPPLTAAPAVAGPPVPTRSYTSPPEPDVSADESGSEAAVITQELEKKKQTLVAERNVAAAATRDTKALVAKQSAINAALQEEIANIARDLRAHEQENAQAKSELAALTAEENKLRLQLRDSKAQLVDLIDRIKGAKAEQSKTQASNARLAQSKQKVDDSLRQYSNQVPISQPTTRRPNPSAAPTAEMPDTHGMSFEDYFGAPVVAGATTSSPASQVTPKRPASMRVASSTPAADPFGADPFKPAPKKVLSPWS